MTAGRDSRVLLGLSMAAGWRPTYYTSGADGDVDVDVARGVTERLGLPYEVVTPEVPQSKDAWTAATARFVAQTDGSATLRGIDDWVDHQPLGPVGLKLWGAGGEIGRAGNIGLAIPFAAQAAGLRRAIAPQRAVLRSKVSHALFRPLAIHTTQAALDDFIRERAAEGWDAPELLESFYAFERVANWAACGVRRAAAATDLYSPFVSRDFIEWCFSLSPGERFVEAPHWRLLGELAPELRDMPFERAWRRQRPRAAQAMLLREVGARGAERVRRKLRPAARGGARPSFGARWLEAGLDVHRELCFDNGSSPLWDLVDRRALERALAASAEERSRRLGSLCTTLTAFWWFHGREAAAPAHTPRLAAVG